MTSPAPLPVRPENIPGELRSLPQWVLWKAEPRDDRISKVPYRPNGRLASSTNPGAWTSFDRALSAAPRFSGIGFVFTATDGICGVDLDHVITDGEVEPWIARMVAAFDSYTEYSFSGAGLHILCKGVIPDGKGRKQEPIEIYDRGRFFATTGRPYGELKPLREAQPEIDLVLEWLKRKEPKPHKATPRVSPCPDDRKLLHKAASSKNGYKFARLWQGDASYYGGDESRADVALLSMLMFWTDGNEARADALFRQSGLVRDKWTKREDYRRRCFDFLARGQ